ncbi:sensor histidine kinase [Luxibacter massiliensis]|uniref:sensor histidine kinase n=1 Tax=Luxibacter massiliensis TaxID=2219695 RepID=UPI000F04E998
MKNLFKNLSLTFVCLCASTVLAFLFFHFGHKNSVNIALVYILTLIIIALNTRGYLYGIAAAVYCVAAVNTFFTYPFFKMDFTLDGYPVTFLGMLTISIITSTTTTRLKKQKEALDERERKLAEADKEKIRANLLRAVSHDFRTPLTSIIGSSASFIEDQENLSQAEQLELVANINEDANWLLNMVENLLTVTRIQNDSGKVKKSLEVVEEVVAEAILRVHKRYPELKIHVDMPQEFLMLPMDATLIEQVLINLLENTWLHANSSRTVDIIIKSTADEVIFTIRDYGVGLDESQIPSIFTGNYISNSTDRRKGIGIGLSICKTIITAHGGTITASNHSNGAEFTFILPLKG